MQNCYCLTGCSIYVSNNSFQTGFENTLKKIPYLKITLHHIYNKEKFGRIFPLISRQFYILAVFKLYSLWQILSFNSYCVVFKMSVSHFKMSVLDVCRNSCLVVSENIVVWCDIIIQWIWHGSERQKEGLCSESRSSEWYWTDYF